MHTDAQTLSQTIARITGVDPRKCMRCGKCSGACPAFDQMRYPPHRFVELVRIGRVEELIADGAMYKCLTCLACLERCPRGVEPSRLVEAVRLMAIRRQGANHLRADDIPAALDPAMPPQLLMAAMRKYAK